MVVIWSGFSIFHMLSATHPTTKPFFLVGMMMAYVSSEAGGMSCSNELAPVVSAKATLYMLHFLISACPILPVFNLTDTSDNIWQHGPLISKAV